MFNRDGRWFILSNQQIFQLPLLRQLSSTNFNMVGRHLREAMFLENVLTTPLLLKSDWTNYSELHRAEMSHRSTPWPRFSEDTAMKECIYISLT